LASADLHRLMERRFPVCFVSCSFSPDDGPLVSWFERMLLALEFDPQKADEPQPRPPPEKIAEMIQTCDCFVAIISKRTKVAAVDGWVGPEWVQNEIGMAYQAGKPMAIFVEEGVEKKGIGRWATDYVPFARSDLSASAPNVVKYLISLRRAVVQSAGGMGEDLPTARALANELAAFASIVNSVDRPRYIPWQMAFMTSRFTGRFYMLPGQVQSSVSAAYDAIDEFEELIKPSSLFREQHSFPPDKVELVKAGKTKVGNAIGKAFVELMQFAYPEEWSAIVDAIKKGQVPPNPPG